MDQNNENTNENINGAPEDEIYTPDETMTGRVEDNGDKGEEETAYHRADAPFSDGSYVPRSEAPKTPRSYSYTQPEMKENLERWERSEREKETAAQKEFKQRKRGINTGAVIALCLVCALLGTLAGGFLLGGMGSSASVNRVFKGNEETVETLPAEEAEEAATEEAVTEETATEETIVEEAPVEVPAQESNSHLSSEREHLEEMAATEIYDLACKQVVGISTAVSYNTYFGVQSGDVTGTGFIVSSDGYILTNYHVIEYAVDGTYPLTVMLYDGESYPATIVGYEGEDNDIAVLKIDAEGLCAATLGDSSDIRVGETVYAVGNPLGELDYTMTKGMISAMDREIDTGVADTAINMFQIDAAVNSGNSGGPVYDTEGKIIGVVTAKYSDTYEDMGIEGLGFAIPINDAIAIANDLIENGYVRGKAYMGVSTKSVSSAAAQYYNMVEGAYVYAIISGSCAESAGLEMGDIITAVDGNEVASVSDLQMVLKNYKAGQDAVLTVYRNGEYVELPITFDEKQPDTGETPTANQDNSYSQQDNPNGQQQQNPNGGYGYGYGYGNSNWW